MFEWNLLELESRELRLVPRSLFQLVPPSQGYRWACPKHLLIRHTTRGTFCLEHFYTFPPGPQCEFPEDQDHRLLVWAFSMPSTYLSNFLKRINNLMSSIPPSFIHDHNKELQDTRQNKQNPRFPECQTKMLNFFQSTIILF